MVLYQIEELLEKLKDLRAEEQRLIVKASYEHGSNILQKKLVSIREQIKSLGMTEV